VRAASSARASSISCAAWRAEVPPISTTNSSPPKRLTTWPSHADRRTPATAFSTRSPTAAAARARDFGQRGTRQARALSILHGLEGSLDFEQGGDIAHSLSAIYREARRLVIEAGRTNDTAPLLRAREMLGEIAEAWSALRDR